MPLPDIKRDVQYCVDALVRECHQTAIDKGWWPTNTMQVDGCMGEQTVIAPDRSFAEQIALMHSELSEALEDYRNGLALDAVEYDRDPVDKVNTIGKPCGIASEFADVLIRIFDTCGRYNIPLAQVLIEKMEYNKTRSIRHGGKKC